MRSTPWLGCVAMAVAVLLSARSFAEAPLETVSGQSAPATTADQSDDDALTIDQLKRRISQDDDTIRGLAQRIERLEQADSLRAAPDDQADAPAALPGLRTPGKQIAEVPQGPSDFAAQVHQVADTAPAPAEAGQFSVSPEAAQHALERALVQTGLMLLRPGEFEIVPSETFQLYQFAQPDQLALTPTGAVLVTQNQQRYMLFQSQVLGRVGLPWEAQLEVATSFDVASQTNTTQVVGGSLGSHTITGAGLGDTSISLIKQITNEGEWMPNVFLSGTFNLGQQQNGLPLGFGYDYFKAAVTAVKRQDPLVFTAGLAYQTNLEAHGILPGDEVIPSVGLLFALSPETSIQAIQQIAFVNGTKFHGVTVPGSSQIEGIFQAGVLSILAPGVVVNLTAAVAETPQTPDLTVQLSVPIRFN